MVVLGEATVELLAELQSDQAGGRGVDRQLGEEVEEFDLAFVAPVGDDLLDLVLDGGRVALHLLAAQCGVVQHLRSPFGVGVEHHTLAEDRRHERVRLGLIEVAVGGAEEELVGLRAGQHDDLLVDQLEPADVAAFLADAVHQPDRIGAELLEVAVLFFATGDPGHDGGGHFSSASSSTELLTFVGGGQRRFGLKLHVRDEAAARGLGDECDGTCQIRRAQEVVVSRLTPLGPVLQGGPDELGGQAPAHDVLVGPGWTMDARTPVPSSSIWKLVTIATSAGLGRTVGAHVRALPQCDVRADEDQVATLAFEHSRQYRSGKAIGADQVDLQLRVEVVGA